MVTSPQIYHITHLRNLSQIVRAAGLLSDSMRITQNVGVEIVGMARIKERRLKILCVGSHPGTNVGEYVPFYFCPRSIMLYLLHMGNHPDLDYREGQRPILHLVADLRKTVAWAEAEGRRWAFSDCNAGAGYARFFSDLRDLDKINWPAVEATDWRNPLVKEGKQAEFLLYGSCPWDLIERIGVKDEDIQRQVNDVLAGARHTPLVTVEPGWYY